MKKATPLQPRMKLPSAEGHRLWAATYDSDPNPLLALESRILTGSLGSLRGKRLLDLACGTGRWTVTARALGAEAFGMDLLPAMVARAQPKLDRPAPLVIGDCDRAPFRDGCFDIVILAFAIGYLAHRRRVWTELRRIVKPGGSVFLSDLHPEALRSGWTRSFRRGPQVIEVASIPYTVEDLRTEAELAGLCEEEFYEAHLGSPESAVFERAGKQEEFERAKSVPAVLAVRWTRR